MTQYFFLAINISDRDNEKRSGHAYGTSREYSLKNDCDTRKCT